MSASQPFTVNLSAVPRLVCGSWLTVLAIYPDGAKIKMDAPPTLIPVTGYFWGIAPWQVTARVVGYPPGSIPPEGWILSGLGPLPDGQPWHFKLIRVGPDGQGGAKAIDCAEVEFVIPTVAKV